MVFLDSRHTLIVVYNDAQFEMTRSDTLPAEQQRQAQDIPEPELDFLTD